MQTDRPCRYRSGRIGLANCFRWWAVLQQKLSINALTEKEFPKKRRRSYSHFYSLVA